MFLMLRLMYFIMNLPQIVWNPVKKKQKQYYFVLCLNCDLEIHLDWKPLLIIEAVYSFSFLNLAVKKSWWAADQVWTSLREGKHARCTRVFVHAACLLWQPPVFAFECLEGGAGMAKVSGGKKEASEGLEWRPGGGKSWDWPYLSRGEFVRVCKCESVRMCDSLLLLGKMKRSVWPGAQREEVKTGRGGAF